MTASCLLPPTTDGLRRDATPPIASHRSRRSASTMGCGASSIPSDGDGQALLSASSDNRAYNTSTMKGAPPKKAEAPKTAPKPAPKPKSKPPPPKPAPAPVQKLPPTSKPINRAHDRIDAIEQSKTIQCGGVKMTYAYLSQRGFYPGMLDRAIPKQRP